MYESYITCQITQDSLNGESWWASLIVIADTFADGNLEGKKGRVWIVGELEVHLRAFLHVVLPFTKPLSSFFVCATNPACPFGD